MGNKLTNVRLRHSALIALLQHARTYIECMDRDYYGQRSQSEMLMCQHIRESLQLMQNVCRSYFDEEGRLMELGEHDELKPSD